MRIVSLALLLAIGAGNFYVTRCDITSSSKQEDTWYHKAGRLTLGATTGFLSAVGSIYLLYRAYDLLSFVKAGALSGLYKSIGFLISKKWLGKPDAWFDTPHTICELLTHAAIYATIPPNFAPLTTGSDPQEAQDPIKFLSELQAAYMLSKLQTACKYSLFGNVATLAVAHGANLSHDSR